MSHLLPKVITLCKGSYLGLLALALLCHLDVALRDDIEGVPGCALTFMTSCAEGYGTPMVQHITLILPHNNFTKVFPKHQAALIYQKRRYKVVTIGVKTRELRGYPSKFRRVSKGVILGYFLAALCI